MAISRFPRQISFIFAVGALRGVPARRGSEKRRRRLERGGDFPHQNNFQKIARAYWQTGAASAAGAVAPKKPGFSLIDEDLLKSRIYTIRGVKVMLDADLAEIYVYASGCWPSMPADEGFLTADWRAWFSNVVQQRAKHLLVVPGKTKNSKIGY